MWQVQSFFEFSVQLFLPEYCLVLNSVDCIWLRTVLIILVLNMVYIIQKASSYFCIEYQYSKPNILIQKCHNRSIGYNSLFLPLSHIFISFIWQLLFFIDLQLFQRSKVFKHNVNVKNVIATDSWPACNHPI